MKLMSPADMQIMDQVAIKDYKIPGILLMEHAAINIFNHLKEESRMDNICIVCGPGNNGGDGLALARLLNIVDSKNLKVILLAEKSKFSDDAKIYLEICEKLDIDIEYKEGAHQAKIIEAINTSETIVDAIFGTGLKREVKGDYKDIIDEINSSEAYVVSVDIPSGINGETGKVMGTAVYADATITFVLPKKGLYLYPAIMYTGQVNVVEIGIPHQIIKDANTDMYSIEEAEMKELLPIRNMRSNKGTYGKVLVIGGSKGMSGAVTLSSLAAYKVGCGIVTAAVPSSLLDIIESKLTEVMTYELPEQDGHIGQKAIKHVSELINKYDVIAIGPGIGRSEVVKKILLEVLVSDKPCVIDADGLYYLSEMEDILKNRSADTIITPHPGEMSRITGYSINEILEDPIKIAREYSIKQNTITVLKLERIVISDTLGNIYINRYGNTGMAKGGSGDVLTGVIAGFIAQSNNPTNSCILGSFVHARAGDIAAHKYSSYSMMPSDLIKSLSEVLKGLEDL